ncbi:MAG: hypothetical protein LBO04_02840 [Spirochaetaceae bacterium]|jgi:hypothetical protein|nr:hypothetical protein [Spirochaetaceae bacterium]
MKTGRILAFGKTFFKRINIFIKSFNETSIFAIWMAGFMLAGAFLWGLTANLRNDITAKTINRILDETEEERRLVAAISTWHIPGNVTQFGTWYVMTSHENAVLFSFIMEGIFVPCLAIVGNGGDLSALIPLTVNADRAVSRMNPGYLRIWIDRIKRNAGILKQALDEKDRRREDA